jgi:hypothetical protein
MNLQMVLVIITAPYLKILIYLEIVFFSFYLKQFSEIVVVIILLN